MYWTDTQIRFTVINNNIEHDMYAAPIPITAESSEFNAPFYFLFNLAVGGQFTDAATPAQVTAPLPGTMYIDYIRVFKLDGLGEVKLGNQVKPETGTFGVFTDNTSTTRKQETGVTSDIWIWNTASTTAGTLPAFEGANVIVWKYTAPQWFGGGIASRQAHDLSNFINGNLKFRIKVPANVGFKIGISDTFTNENWINFPANTTTYGLVRRGDWAQATVPVSVMRGSLVALQSMSVLFSIASIDPLLTSNFEIAIDDIVWECGTSVACQATSSSSTASSIKSSVISSMKSSIKSSVTASSNKSSVASSAASSIKSSVKSSIANSASGYTMLSGTSVRFFANNASWADIHYTINNGGQQNIRMIHNAGSTNTYTLTGIPAGALVKFNYTIGQATGAMDTAWIQFTMSAASSSVSSIKSSIASSIKSSVASSIKSSVANSSSSAVSNYGYTKLSTTSVKFYSNSASWADIHYTVNGGGQQDIRMLHNADNSNSYTLINIPVGAVVRYSYTIGQSIGAVDTAWVQFTM